MKFKILPLILVAISSFVFSVKNHESGYKEVSAIEEVELGEYDRVSLKQSAIPDFDRKTINTEDNPYDAYHSIPYSKTNANKSFSFSFEIESYSTMSDFLHIRIGASGSWDSGHYYYLVVTNTQIELYERNNTSTVYYSSALSCNLSVGQRHTVEFGSIYLKDSTTKTYDFVKCDGSTLFEAVKTPYNSSRTGRVGIYYSGNNIYLGNSIPLEEQNIDKFELFQTNYSNGRLLGLYLTSKVDDGIQAKTDWSSRGTLLDLDNVLLNGEQLYTYNMNQQPVFVKCESNRFYLDVEPVTNKFKSGDVLSLDGYFNIMVNNYAHLVYSNPVYLLYKDNSFTQINDFDQYLIDLVKNRTNYDYYDFINTVLLDDLIEEFTASISSYIHPKEKWALYNTTIKKIDEIPYNEEKVSELLEEKKKEIKSKLDSYNDENTYEGEYLETVIGYINEYKEKVDNATDVSELDSLFDEFVSKVKLVKTRLEKISSDILNNVDGYEQYLAPYDVVTTTDLNVSGGVSVYSKNGSESSFNNNDLKEGKHFYSNSLNPSGNVIFQATYISSNPSSHKYGNQFFIRLRGIDKTNYRFSIGGGNPSLGIVVFEDDRSLSESFRHYNFVANTEYKIELGAIDLKDFEKTYLFIKINDVIQIKKIVDSLDYSLSNSLIIMDSYTADNSSDYASLLPIEEGTTKLNDFTPIGRFALDKEASKEEFKLSLAGNNIPNHSSVYSIDEAAVKINDIPLNSGNKVNPIFNKVSETSYIVNLDKFDYDLQDGDTVTFSGLFSYLNNNVKNIYKIYESRFIYHSETDSFAFVDPSLEDVILEAKETVTSSYDLNNYSSTGQAQINSILNEFTSAIDNASSNEEAYEILGNVLTNIKNVLTASDEYRKNAKNEINSYLDISLYKEEDVETINEILNTYFAYIDESTTNEEIDNCVISAKAELDKILTSEEKDTKELNEYKKEAQNNIEKYIGKLDLSKYSANNIDRIQKLVKKAKADVISKNSKEEIDQVLEEFYETINGVPTKNGSIFDGEKYVIQVENNGYLLTLILPIVGVIAIAAIVITIVIIKKRKMNKA
ncbi:MAG: hypothetical protein J6M95_01895 [Bacilli bacterium]|nr:hypothetical protein [Bacilli bacterium]